MNEQTEIFPRSGDQLKENGMNKALTSAEDKTEHWGAIAYQLLESFISQKGSGFHFMTEDIRAASEGVIPEPPSKRAWGAVITKAKREKLIEHSGYGQVKNPKAHKANASVWVVL